MFSTPRVRRQGEAPPFADLLPQVRQQPAHRVPCAWRPPGFGWDRPDPDGVHPSGVRHAPDREVCWRRDDDQVKDRRRSHRRHDRERVDHAGGRMKVEHDAAHDAAHYFAFSASPAVRQEKPGDDRIVDVGPTVLWSAPDSFRRRGDSTWSAVLAPPRSPAPPVGGACRYFQRPSRPRGLIRCTLDRRSRQSSAQADRAPTRRARSIREPRYPRQVRREQSGGGPVQTSIRASMPA